MKILDIPRSGSFAGITSSRNRFGQYVRNRRSPVQPVGTGRRAFIRAAFGAASTGWSGLTDTQRAAWHSFAADHPVTNSLGATVTLTGHQMYTAVQTQRQNIGQTIATDPPASTDTPSLSAVTVTWFTDSTGEAVYTISGAGTVLLAFSPPLSPGRGFPPRFWQGDIHTSVATETVTEPIGALVAAEFGTPIEGQKLFMKATPVNSEGWTGTPSIVSTIVAAP